MPNIGTPELLIILLVVVLIFGSAKLRSSRGRWASRRGS